MWFIKTEPDKHGCYGTPKSERFWPCLELCDELLEDYAAMGGFVIPTIDNDGERVTGITLNEEAKAAWEVLHPEPAPQPNPEEDAEAMMVDLAYRVTLLEMGVSE